MDYPRYELLFGCIDVRSSFLNVNYASDSLQIQINSLTSIAEPPKFDQGLHFHVSSDKWNGTERDNKGLLEHSKVETEYLTTRIMFPILDFATKRWGLF